MCSLTNINTTAIDEYSLSVTLHGMKSTLMKDILDKIVDLANTNSNVVITGEQGTGKQWFARLIHYLSSSEGATLYHLSCEHFKESLDFDHSEQTRRNFERLLQSGENCTILIDKFSELTLDAQLKLLGCLASVQESGEQQLIKNTPRLIFTMSNQWHSSNTKNYVWTYLYNLLSPISVIIPPLREHREDIYPFSKLFLKQLAEEHRKNAGSEREIDISDRALYRCITYSWPGNIRQLKNAITHAYFNTNGSLIQPADLPVSLNLTSAYYEEKQPINKSWSYINAEKQLLNNKELKTGEDNKELSITSWLRKLINSKK